MYIFTDLILILISISINSSLKLVPISPLFACVSVKFFPSLYWNDMAPKQKLLQITLLCTEKPEDLVHLLSFSICYTYTYRV